VRRTGGRDDRRQPGRGVGAAASRARAPARSSRRGRSDMNKPTEDPRWLSRPSRDEDLRQVAALFDSAKAAPEEELPRLHWRLRASLRFRATHTRRLVRMILVAGGLLLTGGMVGAMVQPFWRQKIGRAPTADPDTRVTRRSAGKRSSRSPAEACAPAPAPAPLAAAPVKDEPPAPPAVRYRAPMRLARRAAAPVAIPDLPPAPPEAPAAAAPPSPTTVEQTLLSDVLRSLRAQHDPQAALALLDQHARRFPETALGPEAAMFRVEALLGLGRKAEALLVLDALPVASMPNRDAQLVLRGE